MVPAMSSVELMDDPLAYLAAEHGRQRSVCALLRAFADAGAAERAPAREIIAFLERDVLLHHQDEIENLYPLLRRRALPEDDLDAFLALLDEERRQAGMVMQDVIAALSSPGPGTIRIDHRTARSIYAYTASEQRHLALGNAIVLAIARIRLTRGDLRDLSRAMKLRRGGTA